MKPLIVLALSIPLSAFAAGHHPRSLRPQIINHPASTPIQKPQPVQPVRTTPPVRPN
jgi:hypothetical protein